MASALQVSFDLMCQMAREIILLLTSDQSVQLKLASWVPIVAALPAAVLACLLSHPGDMVLTEYYKGGGSSVIGSLQRIVGDKGLGGLFLGIKVRIGRLRARVLGWCPQLTMHACWRVLMCTGAVAPRNRHTVGSTGHLRLDEAAAWPPSHRPLNCSARQRHEQTAGTQGDPSTLRRGR